MAGPSAMAARPRAAIRGGAVSAPALRIDVVDGRKAAKPGDLLTYTVDIHNLGMTGATGLEIVQTLPAGLVVVSASRHGRAHTGYVTWNVNLPAGHADSFGVVGRLGQTPRQLQWLATTACANTRGRVKPLVCATHSDELPAGAIAAAYARRAAIGEEAARQALSSLRPVGALLLAGAAAALGLRWLALRRRSRRRS